MTIIKGVLSGMTISKADRYTEISQYLLEEARQQLDRGDLIQASEKAWGAAAHAIKSLAQTRGWNHTRHDLLADVVEQISEEWDRTDLFTLFNSAESMHHNFYEHHRSSSYVQVSINDVTTLIEELHTLRQQPPRPFDPETRDQQARLRKLTRRPPPDDDDVSDLPPVRPVPPGEAD
jgi:uncharacterized protein (UPF0332 family)